MSSQPFDFSAPPLDPEDERLVDIYRTIGRPLDELPYTDEFDRICDNFFNLGRELTNSDRRVVFQRLVRLGKRGRLPRTGPFAY